MPTLSSGVNEAEYVPRKAEKAQNEPAVRALHAAQPVFHLFRYFTN